MIIKDGIIYNYEGNVVGVMSNDATPEDVRSIELGTDLIPVANEFIEQVDAGALRAKYTYNQIKNVFDRHPKIGA